VLQVRDIRGGTDARMHGFAGGHLQSDIRERAAARPYHWKARLDEASLEGRFAWFVTWTASFNGDSASARSASGPSSGSEPGDHRYFISSSAFLAAAASVAWASSRKAWSSVTFASLNCFN
jgi:hypothetical protein